VSWLLLFPAAAWLIYQSFPPSISGYELDSITFLILLCIVAALPIIVNETPIFFNGGVSLAIFLAFGLFIEMIFMQVAVVVLLVSLHITKKDLFRLPMNSLMFMMVSVSGAFAFYLLGGETGNVDLQSFQTFIPIVGYIITTFTVNHIIVYYIKKYVYKRANGFFTKDLIWEAMTTLLVMPVGFVLYLLYIEIGLNGIFYVGLPFVSLAIILQLYYRSQNVNVYLQKVSEIGHQLSERLQVNEVLTHFLAKLSNMLKVDYAYIIDVKENDDFEVVRYIEHGEDKELQRVNFNLDNGVVRYIYQVGESLLFKYRKEWQHLSEEILPHDVESIIAVPVIRNQETVGVILLASMQKRAYERFQLMIVNILANYLAVAIENAKHYEETRNSSERCALTGLYNYRYFENRLQNEYDKKTNLSLILLDIDHFKNVNDTYGHQAGNQILCELANRLVDAVGAQGTVARYGGEEFAVLLPTMDRFTAYHLAEAIRLAIYKSPFGIQDHLSDKKRNVNVHITASIGVASAPEDGDDPMSLIRHADRALYTGAKQKGRNKVAQYVK
jgi:diguanylate cyclase (GGDEF)-like protein